MTDSSVSSEWGNNNDDEETLGRHLPAMMNDEEKVMSSQQRRQERRQRQRRTTLAVTMGSLLFVVLLGVIFWIVLRNLDTDENDHNGSLQVEFSWGDRGREEPSNNQEAAVVRSNNMDTFWKSLAPSVSPTG